MAKIPVGDTINYAYSFTFGNLLTILGLTWLPLAISAGISYYAQTLWFEWFSKFPMFMSGARPDPQAMVAALSDMGSYAGLGLLATLVTLFMSAIVAVAVTSQSFGTRTGQPFVHFAVGAPEWRVFGGYIRLFFSIIGIAFIAALGIGIAVFIGQAISGGQGGGLGGILAGILCIAVLCLALLTIVRMSYLMVPSIVAEPGKGGLARSYHLTRGNFWRIFVVTIVLVLPIALVAGAIQGAVIGNSFMSIFTEMQQHSQNGQPPSPEAMQQIFASMMEKFRQNFLPTAIINFISSIFLSGLIYSGGAYAYRALASTSDATPQPAPATA